MYLLPPTEPRDLLSWHSRYQFQVSVSYSAQRLLEWLSIQQLEAGKNSEYIN
jgi:hypothetical protein